MRLQTILVLFLLLNPFPVLGEVVQRAVDGDTLKLTDGRKIRLLGVDTPETHHPFKPVQCWGPESAQFTKEKMEGKKIKLEYDSWNRMDRFGRILAYVWREDGFFLNEELISKGFARAYTRYPFSRKERFEALESRARRTRKGLWGACP